jgi:hypothetical protein
VEAFSALILVAAGLPNICRPVKRPKLTDGPSLFMKTRQVHSLVVNGIQEVKGFEPPRLYHPSMLINSGFG